MKTLFFIFFFLSSVVAAANTCFKSEKNFRTHVYFSDENEYQEELDLWEAKSPKMPSIFSLMIAYDVYSKEKSVISSIRSDKIVHCYMGCRISQRTDYKTADYVGWLKEERDLKDCKSKTHFDEADYMATVRGAQIGENQASNCLQACGQVYGKK